MGTECDKLLSVLVFAPIAPRCSSPSKNPCSTEHQTHAALQTHVRMCDASSKSALMLGREFHEMQSPVYTHAREALQNLLYRHSHACLWRACCSVHTL